MAGQEPPRRIMINGLDYVWKASMIDAHYTLVRVWLEGDAYKAGPILARCRFDDPWQDVGPLLAASSSPKERRRAATIRLDPLTPGLIRQIVEAARLAGWQPEIDRRELHFEWVSGDLRPVDDATLPGEDPFGILRAN